MKIGMNEMRVINSEMGMRRNIEAWQIPDILIPEIAYR